MGRGSWPRWANLLQHFLGRGINAPHPAAYVLLSCLQVFAFAASGARGAKRAAGLSVFTRSVPSCFSPTTSSRLCVCVCVSVSPFSLSRCPPCSSFRGRKGGPSLARSPLPLRANMCPEPCLSPDAWFEAVGAVCVHEPGTQRFTKGLDDLITWTETTPKCDRGQLDILFRILRLGGELKVREEIFPLYLFVLQMYARLDLRQHEWADFIIYDHLELLDTALVLAWRMEKARGASPAEFAIANMDCIGVVCDKYPFMELSSGRRFERLLAIHFMERACSESHLGDEMWRDTLSDLLEMHQSGQGTSVSAFV